MSKNSKIDQTVNIGKENIDMSMKFSGEMCLMIILKVTKKQDFSLPLQSTVLKKIQGEGEGGGQIEFNTFRKKESRSEFTLLTAFLHFLQFLMRFFIKVFQRILQ